MLPPSALFMVDSFPLGSFRALIKANWSSLISYFEKTCSIYEDKDDKIWSETSICDIGHDQKISLMNKMVRYKTKMEPNF